MALGLGLGLGLGLWLGLGLGLELGLGLGLGLGAGARHTRREGRRRRVHGPRDDTPQVATPMKEVKARARRHGQKSQGGSSGLDAQAGAALDRLP